MELEGIRAWLEWNGLRCETIYNFLLNSELSTLFHVSNGGPIRTLSDRLTANTRNREDLPAF